MAKDDEARSSRALTRFKFGALLWSASILVLLFGVLGPALDSVPTAYAAAIPPNTTTPAIPAAAAAAVGADNSPVVAAPPPSPAPDINATDPPAVKAKAPFPERPIVTFSPGLFSLLNRRVLTPLVGPGCSSSLLSFHVTDIQCVRLLLSKVLGVGLVAGGAVIKLPQIVKIVRKRSALGVSFESYALETSAYIAGLAYNVRKGNAFNTYGEHAFMAVANVIVVALMFHYKGRHSALNLVLLATFVITYSLFSPSIVSDGVLLSLQWVAILIGVFSKVPQILENYQTRSTGQLSVITVGLQAIGSLARCFTTITEVGDPVILITYVVATALNGFVFYQIYLYWGRPRRDTMRKD